MNKSSFFIVGQHAVIEALKNPKRKVLRVFLTEESIDFKELTVPILNGKCLTPVEIITKESFYNFNAKYVNDDTELNEFIISDKKKMELEQICLKTLDIVQARGWLRVDLMQDSNQNFYVLEVNTVPGMTSHSLFPKSAKLQLRTNSKN